MCYAMVLTAIGPLIIEISKTFNLSLTQAGLIFTINFIGLSVFILIGGICADIWGKKKMLVIVLLTLTISLGLFSAAPNFIVLCIGAFFMGGSGGIIESVATALLTDINLDGPERYVNLAQVFFGLGAFVGPIVIGVFINMNISWRINYMIWSMTFLLLTLALIFIRMPQKTVSEKISISFLKTLYTDKRFLVFCLCMLLYTGSEVGAWGWLSTFMQSEFKFSPLSSSITVGIFWIAMIVGRIICTILNQKINAKTLIIILASLSVAVVILAGLVKSSIGIWIAIVLLGLVFSGQWPLIVIYGTQDYEKGLGTIIATYVGCGGIGMSLIPFIMGVIGDNFGIRLSMLGISLFFVGIVIAMLKVDNLASKENT